MVTGSHIPFDRNGYKTNTAAANCSSTTKPPSTRTSAQVRASASTPSLRPNRSSTQRPLQDRPRANCPRRDAAAAAAYIRRYTDFFAGRRLAGRRLLVYQHSAVGRDLLVEVLRRLGADVIPAGRSETFVPIDTENIDAAQLAIIQATARQQPEHGPFDAVVSTDGDSDRPLILGVQSGTGRARFFGGDLVGMVVAEYLQADAVVVPISCNDAIDRGPLAAVLEPKTRIGSPFVIAGMEAACQGPQGVCGWGGQWRLSDRLGLPARGPTLYALPTRRLPAHPRCALSRGEGPVAAGTLRAAPPPVSAARRCSSGFRGLPASAWRPHFHLENQRVKEVLL